MAARSRKKKKGGNLLGAVAIGFVVILLLGVLSVHTVRLKATEANYREREAALQREYAGEEARTEELNKYKVYVQTKEYIESAAGQHFGLIYPGQILIKPEK